MPPNDLSAIKLDKQVDNLGRPWFTIENIVTERSPLIKVEPEHVFVGRGGCVTPSDPHGRGTRIRSFKKKKKSPRKRKSDELTKTLN